MLNSFTAEQLEEERAGRGKCALSVRRPEIQAPMRLAASHLKVPREFFALPRGGRFSRSACDAANTEDWGEKTHTVSHFNFNLFSVFAVLINEFFDKVQ